jgi:tRNA(adenine34) deaminase
MVLIQENLMGYEHIEPSQEQLADLAANGGSIFNNDDHGRFMLAALQEAVAAGEEDEVPIGAVVAYQGKIIGRAHNQRETLSDPTAHAEMIALTQASSYLNSWRLHGCTMYVTLEPCPMCAGALVLSRIDRLVYGPADPKAGACESLYEIVTDPRLNHRIEVISDFMTEPCRHILQEFFAAKRKKK